MKNYGKVTPKIRVSTLSIYLSLLLYCCYVDLAKALSKVFESVRFNPAIMYISLSHMGQAGIENPVTLSSNPTHYLW